MVKKAGGSDNYTSTPISAMDRGEMEDEMEEEESGEDSEEPSKEEQEESDMSEFNGAIKQIQAEYDFAYWYIKQKWDKWLVRLKLYNNQKRDPEAIGDPLLFTIFQTVLASLYSDKLVVEFVGRERGDDECAENLTILAQYDSEEMQKETVDYDWLWDTAFFGRGLVLLNEFDDETKTPIPEVIDPLTLLRDPDAISVNGDRKGRGAARFFGREVRMTRRELETAGVYTCLHKLGDTDSALTPVEENKQARREAQGYDNLRNELTGDNKSYVLYEWWTWWKGERYVFTLNQDRTAIIRAEKIKTKAWPVADRQIFPTAHDWDGVSIPDLVEDKQRGRATLLNLAKKGVTANLYPNYLYNNLLIKNKADLAKFEFNKFTGVAGNPQGVVVPIERKNITTDVQWMLDMMDQGSQKATATPDIQQGAFQEKVKSATEIAKVSQGVDTRYALQVKILGWSEKAFWRLWYELYYVYYKEDIYEKIVRISGPFGPTYKKVQRQDLIGIASPDIMIESKAISDAKKMNRVNMLMAVLNQAVALDPSTNKRFGLKELMKAAGMTTDEINRMLPKTYDEYEAEEENRMLDKNKTPKLIMTQNHMVHIEIHSKAADTKAKKVHIEMHKIAMYALQHNKALQPKPMLDENGIPIEGSEGQSGGTPMEQGKTPSPRDMAQSPLQLQSPTAVQMAQ